MKYSLFKFGFTLFAAAALLPAGLYAQGGGGRGGRGGGGGGRGGAAGGAQSAKAAAPIDLTGYWVSVITEDWRYRMVTPSHGDYQGVPMTPTARMAADTWDPAKEVASECKNYGAPALLRQPTRLHITWADDNTLKMESDNGKQVRLFHFGDWKGTGAPSLQGDSLADWESAGGRGGRGGGGGGRGGAAAPARSNEPPDGSLHVVTTNLKAGYLRKNGVPYSDKTALTEYFDLMREPNGSEMFVVTISTVDPTYLSRAFVISSQFKKEPGDTDAKWKPGECEATW